MNNYLSKSHIVRKIILVLFCIIFLYSYSFSQIYEHWGDRGNGKYNNPVLPADYSDLDIIRVGNDYYAISSTMQFSPGMVVLHSIDLVNWEIISHVVKDITQISDQLNWDKMNRYGRGIWAGSIRYYKNKFWVYFGTPDEGFFMSSADNAAGPWAPLHKVWGVSGWDDCCSFCDDDGKLYFIATNFALDVKNNKAYNVHLFKMSPDGKELIQDSDTIIYQSKGSEANKLYKINGLYYHYFSQVNSLGQRYIMMGRSKNIYGPYETKQINRVDKQKDREPNQGGLIEVNKNKWYFFTHHGRGDWEGRPASLQPVSWVNNWPIIGKLGVDTVGEMIWEGSKPINARIKYAIKANDGFESLKLNEQWEWNYQPRADKWSLTDRKGYLRLYAFKPIDAENNDKLMLRVGNIITQRCMRTLQTIAEIKMDIANMADGQYAGLTHFSTVNYSTIGIKQEAGIRKLIYTYNGKDTVLATVNERNIWLKSTWDIHGINMYSYSINGKDFYTLSFKSQLTWGSYRGDRIGIYSYNVLSDNGFVDIDYYKNSASK